MQAKAEIERQLRKIFVDAMLPSGLSTFYIPAKRFIKLDVGLSSNAPQSFEWLRQSDPCEAILGFEPSTRNIQSLRSGSSIHAVKIDPLDLNHKVFLIPVALGSRNGSVDFYETAEDSGQSSLLRPRDFAVENAYKVPCFRLDDIWDALEKEDGLLVSHLKTDCQGTDLGVLQGAHSLLEKCLFVTSEAENGQYIGSRNGKSDLFWYLLNRRFIYLPRFIRFFMTRFSMSVVISTEDPTFVNLRFLKEAFTGGHVIWQRG